MKVGTDGVTLGAWAPCTGRVLDVGAGCGLIGLMAAQRGASRVTLLEIDPAAAVEAADNARRSPWADRIDTVCADFLAFSPDGMFDSIISNPPFFANGEHAPDSRRAAARHEGELTAATFMARAASMLAPQGTVSVILPPDRADNWTFAACMNGLHTAVICRLLTKAGAPPRRVLLTFSREGGNRTASLAVNSDHYRSLTSEFYL